MATSSKYTFDTGQLSTREWNLVFSQHREATKHPTASLSRAARLPQEASHWSPPEPVAVPHHREEKANLTGGFRNIPGGDALLGLEVLQRPVRAGASAWTP